MAVHAPDSTLVAALLGAVARPDQVKVRALDRHAAASDASHYLEVPEAVVVAETPTEIGRLLAVSAAHRTPLTFRSGGTSLSGQGITSGVLVDTRRAFRRIDVRDDGARVRVQPGATVRQLNAHLAPYGRKFGPDPASEAACTIGGVVANNSSGMACGTVDNAYQTLESLVLVLPSGTVVDTGARDADARLRALEPELHAGLLRLRDRVRAEPESVATIRRQFAMKNTMGYGLNAFLDHDDPVDVLAHLAVGSEGTLAFVAEATFRTIPLRPHVATALLVFDDLASATGVLPELVATGAATVELLDASSLRVGQTDPKADDALRAIAVERHAALLVEYQAEEAGELAELRAPGDALLERLPLSLPATLTGDAAARASLWHVRKGLYASVAGARPQGTTALLEDVVVPVASLRRTCEGLIDLFGRHGYDDSVIFGHAKDGNVHFMLTDAFAEDAQLARYTAFTEEMVDLVLGHGGSLKAEHGTGRVMAPYVRRQYGDELYEVMRELKHLVDPAGMLNPGVILDDDPEAHLRHIKATPQVEDEVDRCVECGYCEPVCPSKDLTLTPRQRIVLRRTSARAQAEGDEELVAAIDRDYAYEGVETCAADGMCATACPVAIDTGALVKRLRTEQRSRGGDQAWAQAAGHWGVTTRAAATGLDVASRVPDALPVAATAVGRRLLGDEVVPAWAPDLPSGGARRGRPAPTAAPDAVYLPACVGAMFGPADGGIGVQRALEALCARAGLELAVPEGVDELCCGTPWTSKGLQAGAEVMREKVRASLLAATGAGALPVVTDASSCTEGLRDALDDAGAPRVEVIDVVTFVAERVLPLLPDHQRLESLVLHPTCSSTQLGLDDDLRRVASAVAHDVRQPLAWGCCAFAGDRGLLHPELTASATRAQAAEVARLGGDAHASCNRTCELGMTRATGRPYRHVVELLEEVTR